MARQARCQGFGFGVGLSKAHRLQRFQTPVTRPRHVKVSCALFDPWATLGVSKNASEKDIKKAHRKLVLREHPDVKGGDDPLAHARFMRIQEAYELITGKCQGKDIGNTPADRSGWQFHDWYWKFSMKRRKGKFGTAMADAEPAPEAFRQQWQAQMAGLKQKAAAKRSRHQWRRQGATGGTAAGAGSPAGGPTGSEAARETVWRSMTKNARNADKAVSQPVAAPERLGDEHQGAPQEVAAASQQRGQQPEPTPSTAATAGSASAASQMPLHHAVSAHTAWAVEQQEEQYHGRHHDAAREEAINEDHAGPSASSSHIERLRLLLEHAATLVHPAVEGSKVHSHAEGQPAGDNKHVGPGGVPGVRRFMRGRMMLDQLAALLAGRSVHAQGHPEQDQGVHHEQPQHQQQQWHWHRRAGSGHSVAAGAASSAVPADEHLHHHIEASMRAHRSGRQQQQQQQHAASASPAHGPATNEQSDEEMHHQQQYSQYRGSDHARKFANRDEVERRLSSQLAGLKRRAALKQGVESNC